jgi:hypothetical protein
LVSAGHPKKALYAVSKSTTSNCMVSVQKFSQVTTVTEERFDRRVSLLH